MSKKRDFGATSLERMFGSKIFLFGALIILMIAGYLFIDGAYDAGENETRKLAMDIARTAKVSLPIEKLASLDASAEDIDKPEYAALKKSLMEIIDVNSDFQFAYLYVQKEGKIFFLADSQAPDSADYSPPGQEYTEADAEAKLPFQSGEPLITKKSTDRWGTWISILVPIKDEDSGETIAVFGMDYPAELWSRQAVAHAYQDAVMAAAALLLLFSFHMIMGKNRILKRSQAAAKKSEEEYRMLSDATIEGVVIHQGKEIRDLNKSLEKMFGYSRDDMLGQCFSDFFSEEDKVRVREKIISNSNEAYIASAVRKSGETFTVSIEGREFNIDNETLRVASIRDITKQKLAEEALTESNERMRAITDSAQDGIIIMNHKGLISYWNPAAERIMGYTKDEAMGQDLFTFTVPKHLQAAYKTAYPGFGRIGQEGSPGRTVDINVYRKDGREIPLQLSLSTVKTSKGYNAVVIIRDTTSQKKAEAELILSKEMAEAATKAKSDFLANMSHEIRTPMNAVIGFSGLMAKTELTGKQEDYIRKIDSAARSLLSIINDILDFSKIEAGKLQIESVDFQLDEVVNNIVEMITVKAGEKNIELLSDLPSDVPRALIGDPMRLGQILVNLASNAVKFTDKGYILIKTDLMDSSRDTCRIRFSVIDTGIGMTPEQIDKLFIAFSQADSSITRKFGGTGLGLTISKSLSELMGGELSVTSEAGQGSTFTYIAEFKRQQNGGEKSFDTQKLQKLKVLIVDDNEMARAILKSQLLTLGIHSDAVDSGQAAIELLRRESALAPYDLVLMDLRMPEMDGIETSKRIAADKDLVAMPLIIMISAFGREELIKQAKGMGIKTFLMKPVNLHLLYETIMNTFGEDTESPLSAWPAKDTRNTVMGLDGLRVLVAEDNVLNQEVAAEILTSAGMVVEIANNGQEAVAAVCKLPYDLVLMDIQMPVMGGFEATKKIRSMAQLKDLPIIAMTAHAMQGAREDCLAAGMNDYVSKPIDPATLFATIRKWLKPKTALRASKAEKTASQAADLTAFISLPADLPGVDMQAGLNRLNGNRKLYRKLLFDFSASYNNASQTLGDYLHQNDTEAALRLAHTIKGVAGNISAFQIQKLAEDIEEALLRQDKTEAKRLLKEFGRAISLMNDSLSVLPIPAEAPGIQKDKTADAAQTQPLMRRLAKLIRENNVNAGQAFDELQKYIEPDVCQKEMNELASSIDDYDFDAAIRAIQEVAIAMGISLEGD